MWLKMPSISVPIWAKVYFCVKIRFIKPRVFSDLMLKKVKDFGVNRVKNYKNFGIGIWSPARESAPWAAWGSAYLPSPTLCPTILAGLPHSMRCFYSLFSHSIMFGYRLSTIRKTSVYGIVR